MRCNCFMINPYTCHNQTGSASDLFLFSFSTAWQAENIVACQAYPAL